MMNVYLEKVLTQKQGRFLCEARGEFVRKYAWAIPNDRAIDTLAKHGPIVEIGAGTGYWASLLQARGVECLPFDTFEENGWVGDERYTTVEVGGAEMAALYPAHALFLCWPPYDDNMACEALSFYRGKTLVFVGEGEGGCTANDNFFAVLAREWNEVDSVTIPQWDGLHDYMRVFTRKG